MSYRSSRVRRNLLAAVLVTAGTPAAAQGHLAVNAPPGHTVEKEQATGSYTESLSVASTLDSDAGCVIGFQPMSAPGVTQAQLNAVAATPAFAATVKSFLAIKFDTTNVGPYAQAGVQGVQVVGKAKGEANVENLTTILGTPRGRTNIACIGPAARFETLRPEFEAITRGVVPPR